MSADRSERRDIIIIEQVPLASIIVGDQLIRADAHDDGIRELAMDIQAHGLMQPIGVRPGEPGKYQLLWGYRRLMAHRLLGRACIAARLIESDGDSVRSVAIRENIHRLSMSLAEECATVAHLHDIDEMSPTMIAERLGKSRAWVDRRLSIPHLPIEVQDELMADRITIAAAEALAGVPDDNQRAYIMQQHIIQRWTQRQLAECIALVAATPDTSEAIEAGVQAARQLAQPITVVQPCAACGQAHAVHELMSMRVCVPCGDHILHSLPTPRGAGGDAGGGQDGG